MPELPEVETVCREMEKELLSQTIKSIDVTHRKLRIPLLSSFEKDLQHLTIESIQRRAKFILINFKQSSRTLVIHLGMSGRIVITSTPLSQNQRQKHEHIVIQFTSGQELRYFDPRRFGSMEFIESIEEKFKKYGIEPLTAQFTAAYLYERFQGKNTALKTALLNQSYIAGLGNIYVCEALHQAGLHPLLKARNLTLFQAEKLVFAIKDVLLRALEAGGSTLRDHRRANGDPGLFQHSFNVYDQAKKTCTTCRRGKIQRIKQSQRSTFYCDVCQSLDSI